MMGLLSPRTLWSAFLTGLVLVVTSCALRDAPRHVDVAEARFATEARAEDDEDACEPSFVAARAYDAGQSRRRGDVLRRQYRARAAR